MKLKLINGNNKPYTTETDLKIVMVSKGINEAFFERVKTECGLVFKEKFGIREAKPKNAMQIVKFLSEASTYSFNISYSDNASEKCTLFIKIKERENLFK